MPWSAPGLAPPWATRRYSRDKLDTLVHFPLKGLDMSPYLLGRQAHAPGGQVRAGAGKRRLQGVRAPGAARDAPALPNGSTVAAACRTKCTPFYPLCRMAAPRPRRCTNSMLCPITTAVSGRCNMVACRAVRDCLQSWQHSRELNGRLGSLLPPPLVTLINRPQNSPWSPTPLCCWPADVQAWAAATTPPTAACRAMRRIAGKPAPQPPSQR